MENEAANPKAAKKKEEKKAVAEDDEDDIMTQRFDTESDAQNLDASSLLQRYGKDLK